MSPPAQPTADVGHAPATPPALAGARRVVIVGGGFTGTCAAINLVRHSAQPLHICLVDPAEQPGRGLAHSTPDADHRLNAPTVVHSVLPDDLGHFSRWCVQQNLLAQDPEAEWADGSVYARRRDFGRYLQHTLQAHAQGHGPGGASRIHHLRDTAVGLAGAGLGHAHDGRGGHDGHDGHHGQPPLTITTASGHHLPADQVLLATGHPRPGLPPPLDPALAAHPAVLVDPWDLPRVKALPADARLLLLGSGLTALDLLSTLVRQGHRGDIRVVSRHGLRPVPPGPLPPALAQVRGLAAVGALPGGLLLDRLNAAPPPWLAGPELPPDLRQWLRALRAQIRQAQAAGQTWHMPFDALRDALWQLWPRLPAAQQRRYWRTLRPWYDVHRYRSAPQNQALVDAAVAAGRIRFISARLTGAEAVHTAAGAPALQVRWAHRGSGQPGSGRFEAVINCTGQDAGAGHARNPLLAAGLQAGWLQPHASGAGLAVDAQCRALGADGRPHPALWLLGPPTVGHWGDPIGALYIAAQVHRVLPTLLADVA